MKLIVNDIAMEFDTDYGRRFIKYEEIIEFEKMPSPEFYFKYLLKVKKDKKVKTYRISEESYLTYKKVRGA